MNTVSLCDRFWAPDTVQFFKATAIFKATERSCHYAHSLFWRVDFMCMHSHITDKQVEMLFRRCQWKCCTQEFSLALSKVRSIVKSKTCTFFTALLLHLLLLVTFTLQGGFALPGKEKDTQHTDLSGRVVQCESTCEWRHCEAVIYVCMS